MTTNFPTSLDTFVDPQPTDTLNSSTVPHAAQHANINDSVLAVETKVGINGSTDPNSLDYKVSHLGTAAQKAASDATKSTLASVTGTPVVGHLASFADGSGTIQDTGTGVDSFLANGKLLSTFNFLDYDYTNATTGGDVTTSGQNFLITCYLEAITWGALTLSDQATRTRVLATCPATYPLHVKCPWVVPPFVDFAFKTTIERIYDATGTVTNFYNGDTTTKALVNVYQPLLYLTPLSHCSQGLNLYCNPDGVHPGSGFYGVRGWQMAGANTIGTAGTGYTNGDTVSLVNPHKSPYSAATFQLTVSGGNVTAATMVSGGVWPAPPKLLRKMWVTTTNAAGQNWAALVAANTPGAAAVFDGSGNWITTGGTGTGLTLNIPDDTTGWVADFSAGAHSQDFHAYQTNTVIGPVDITGVGTTTDATYGPMRATFFNGLNLYIDHAISGGGYIGNQVNGIDVLVGNRLYNVGGFIQFKKFAGGNFQGRVECDTPAAGGHYFDVDHFEGSDFDIWCFNNGASDLTGASYAGRIGANDTNISYASRVKVYLQNAGTPAGIPGVFIDYCDGCTVEINATNINSSAGGAAAFPINKLAVLGAHNGSGNTLIGTCDGISGAIVTGTLTGWGINIHDDYAGGWMRDGGLYDITGTTTPTNGTTGVGKAIPGSLYRNGSAAYINLGTTNSPVWDALETAFNPQSVKTSAYAASPQDFIPVDASSESVTITLPTAPADKTRVAAKIINISGSNTATIACGGSDVFNKSGGSTALTLLLLNQGVILQYSAGPAIWYVMADDLALSQLDARYTTSSRTLRGYNGQPLYLPIGGRIFGLTGSGGAYDSTNNSCQDATSYLTPLNYPVKSLRLALGGFDMTSQGEMDRDAGNTITGFASIYIPTGTFTVTTTASSAAGTNTLTFTPGALGGNGPSVGMGVSSTNIPSNTYVTNVQPVYNGSGTITSMTVTVNNNFINGGVTNLQVITFTGKIYPVKWGGRRQYTLEPMHDMLISDPINVEIPANTAFLVRRFSQFAVNSITLSSIINSSRLTGEGSTRGINLADNTLSPLTPGFSGGGFVPPCMILAEIPTTTALPSVLVSGDSIAAGTNDTPNANQQVGYINKLLGTTTCFAYAARGGTTAEQMAQQYAGVYAMARSASCTDILLEHCRNDIWAGNRTAAQVLADLQTIAAPFKAAGMRVWVFTCPPTTSSTDGWITATNQTITNAGDETQRQLYNAALRNGGYVSYGFSGVVDMAVIIEDPVNAGKWNSASGIARTADGVHPNPQGHTDLINANVIPISSFVVS